MTDNVERVQQSEFDKLKEQLNASARAIELQKAQTQRLQEAYDEISQRFDNAKKNEQLRAWAIDRAYASMKNKDNEVGFTELKAYAETLLDYVVLKKEAA